MPAKKSAIETSLVRELAQLLNQEDLTELEVEKDDLRIRLTRGGTSHVAPVAAPAPVVAAASPAPAPTATAPAAASDAPTKAAASGVPVTSPMVGTAYHSPSPGADAFVSVGSKVKKGQTIMIVEAMKTMNQIPASRDGIVASIDIEDGQPVEFGQTLITLE
ncbi:MAG: acetyl-CoA carboxylase biotin carboxyl carrier protein [Ahrensia sp.]|nr:acetyl-CoA carboxylase biotin carboxyl carrier protein [Ahrensia sp.]